MLVMLLMYLYREQFWCKIPIQPNHMISTLIQEWSQNDQRQVKVLKILKQINLLCSNKIASIHYTLLF